MTTEQVLRACNPPKHSAILHHIARVIAPYCDTKGPWSLSPIQVAISRRLLDRLAGELGKPVNKLGDSLLLLGKILIHVGEPQHGAYIDLTRE